MSIADSIWSRACNINLDSLLLKPDTTFAKSLEQQHLNWNLHQFFIGIIWSWKNFFLWIQDIRKHYAQIWSTISELPNYYLCVTFTGKIAMTSLSKYADTSKICFFSLENTYQTLHKLDDIYFHLFFVGFNFISCLDLNLRYQASALSNLRRE